MKFIIPTILILVTFIGLCTISTMIFDDKDSCLDSGVCKEGLSLKDGNTGENFTVNITSCKAHNGQWREKYNDCLFN